MNITDDEDFAELIDVVQQPQRRPKVYRERENHFTKLNDTEFLKRFRFSKDGVAMICDQISNVIESPTER